MKAFFALCVSALLSQTISGQCLGPAPLPLSSSSCRNNLGIGLNNANIPTSGGAFTVTSSSPIAPTGVSVVSENNIEGPLAVNGQLPLLAAVLVEGELPSSGAGAISYSCGSENIGIVSEGSSGVGPSNIAGPANIGLAGPGFANGLAGPGYGSGLAAPIARGIPAGYGLAAGPRGCAGGF